MVETGKVMVEAVEDLKNDSLLTPELEKKFVKGAAETLRKMDEKEKKEAQKAKVDGETKLEKFFNVGDPGEAEGDVMNCYGWQLCTDESFMNEMCVVLYEISQAKKDGDGNTVYKTPWSEEFVSNCFES